MTAKRCWVTVGALILTASLVNTMAFTQNAPEMNKEQAKPADSQEQAKPADNAVPKPAESAKPKKAAVQRARRVDPSDGKLVSPYSLAERIARNKQDCKPNNLRENGLGMHGHYRSYSQWDPELKSIEGRKQFDACVKRGLEPTPWFAFGQRAAIAMGGKFFGRTKEDCLMCHSKY